MGILARHQNVKLGVAMSYIQMTMFMFNKPEPLRQSSLLVLLAGSMGHGESLLRGLRAYELEHKGDWASKVGQLRGLLEMGYSLADALAVIRDMLPAETVSAIRIAERAGTLPNVLISEAQRLTKDSGSDNSTSLFATLMYLSAVFSAMFVVISFVMVFIIPKFKEIFSGFGVMLPSMTVTLISAADGFTTTWPAIVPPIMGATIGSIAFVFYCRYQLLRYGYNVFWNWWPRNWTPSILRQLGFAASSGQPLVNSLDSLLSDAPPGRATIRMSALRHRVHNGDHLVAALLDTGFLNQREAVFLTSATEARHLDWALLHTARTIDMRRERWITRLATVVMPLALIATGCVVFFVVIGLFLPIIQLINDLA